MTDNKNCSNVVEAIVYIISKSLLTRIISQCYFLKQIYQNNLILSINIIEDSTRKIN